MSFQKKERQSVTIVVRLTPSLLAKINETAEKESVNRVDVIREALEHRFKELLP